MKKMLINATQDEVRVAIQKDNILYDLDLENSSFESKIANVYKAVVTRVEPSLEACFVDFGSNRHGFLPLREIAYSVSKNELAEADQKHTISELVHEGQEVMIQVEKEERGNKGAALTTFMSLAGSYLVLMPNNPRAGGISRRIEGNEREELKNALSQLKYPKDMGVIIRTAGLGRNLEALQWDLDVLLKQWEVIQEAFKTKSAPFLIYRESDMIIRAIRDYLRPDVKEIIVDNPDVYQKAKDYIAQICPDYSDRLSLYEKAVPLFVHYKLEKQIESAFQREVKLPSGGRIVIDYTEALVSVDINSSKDTKGGDIEATALNTNTEAAEEIARQMRLRDLSGLIVIDFIDMTPIENQIAVENRLRESCRDDRARVQISRISRFGLLELSRQRLRPVLDEFKQTACPRCNGRGTIRDVHSVGASILRLLEEAAVKSRSKTVYAELPIDIATYLLNNRREAISEMQQRHDSHIVLVPNAELVSPHYKIGRTRSLHKPKTSSNASVPHYLDESMLNTGVEEAAVQRVKPETPSPITTTVETTEKKDGLIKRLWSGLFSKSEEPKEKSTGRRSRPGQRSHGHQSNRKNTRSNHRRNTSSRSTESRHDERRSSSSRSSSTRNSSPRGNNPKSGSGSRNNNSRSSGARGDNPRSGSSRRDNSRSGSSRGSNQKSSSSRNHDTQSTNESSQTHRAVENQTSEQRTHNQYTDTKHQTYKSADDKKPESSPKDKPVLKDTKTNDVKLETTTAAKTNNHEKPANPEINKPKTVSAPAEQFIKSRDKEKSGLQKVETKK